MKIVSHKLHVFVMFSQGQEEDYGSFKVENKEFANESYA